MATPNLKEGVVSVIDMKDWKVIKEVKTAGPAFFMRSHENTPYAWVDAMMSPAKDTMQLLDKRTLEVAKTLRPEPGKIAAHTEFTRDGKYALVSDLGERRGAGDLRHGNLAGSQAATDAQAGGQVQRLQQDHPLRGDEPLERQMGAPLPGRERRGGKGEMVDVN